MPQKRQLAAIMFTDIVGYTALMGEDETLAFNILNQNRSLQKPLVEKYAGNWIKELGDGVLASFSTVTDAINCATSIIKGCEPIEGLQLRIGIHQAEVIFENNDVFGDGVNIASRLLPHAPIGGICISETVRNNVANRKDIVTTFLKEEVLKHVKEPMRIYEVKINNNTPNKATVPAAITIPLMVVKKSIAVLPFVNMSNDPEQEYFSDGMAEEILNSLSHLKDLKVAGRTSSFQFKDKNIDLRTVGEKLGVGHILEGSVRKQGNRLRVTAKLVSLADGFNMWSEKFDRDMDDIFAIQDEIALAITEELKIILLEKEKAVITKTRTDNKEAYDLYLKGRFYYNKRGSYLLKGLEYFQQAIEVDPKFALAYAGVADTYTLMAFFAVLAPHDAVPKAKEAAQKAISLNPNLVEPYTALAFVAMQYDWDWPNVKKKFELAFTINPNFAQLHSWYAIYLNYVEKNNEKALLSSLKGAELEPLISTWYYQIAMSYIYGKNFKAALDASITAIEIDDNYFLAYWAKGLSYIGLGNHAEAIAVLQKSVDLSAGHPWPLHSLCYAYLLDGEIKKVAAIFKALKHRATISYISPLILCFIAYMLEMQAESLLYLSQAFEQRDPNLVAWRVWPFFEKMKAAPIFQSYLEQMDFPA